MAEPPPAPSLPSRRLVVIAIAACIFPPGWLLTSSRVGAEDKPPSPPVPPRRGEISATAIIHAIHTDLASLPVESRRHTRYVSFAEWWNSGTPDSDIETGRHAVVKLLNSLSWALWFHIPSEVMEPRGVLLRIDLRQIRWSSVQWEAITSAPYPYSRSFGTPAEAEAYEWSGTHVPCVRGDWLVAAASKAPLYYALLAPPDAPDALASEASIESFLGGDSKQFPQERVALRTGWKDGHSAVVRRNRVAERRELSKGVLWKTYDFLPGNSKGAVADMPLGPSGAGGTVAAAFERDASSLAFSLPNGFMGFLVVDRSGRRLDAMPRSLVVPGCAPVTAGASCFGCHAAGVQEKADTLTESIRTTQASRPDTLAVVDRLYRPDAVARALTEDRARFLAALRGAGIRQPSSGDDQEPISATTRLFEGSLSPAQAAAELGLPGGDAFLRVAGDRLGPLGEELLAGRAGTIPRQAFEVAFAALAVDAKAVAPPPIDVKPLLTDLARWDAASAAERRAAAELVATRAPGFQFLRMETFSCGGQTHVVAIYLHGRTGLEFALVPVGTFVMGTPSQAAETWHEDEDGVLGWETPHRVRLTKPFLIARTECTEAAYDRVLVADPEARRTSNRPVADTSWDLASEFCRQIGLSLPTEAQWEYACRAGTTTTFHYGSDPGQLTDYAWFVSRRGELRDGPRPVAQGKPNAFGLFDMHGNVTELCHDVFRAWSTSPTTNPVGTGYGKKLRSIRGGSFGSSAFNLRTAWRRPTHPEVKQTDVGLRLAWAVPID
jgi:formylglycine-generating enzyme required for sulfatase activity